jgi:hypothetical protein
MNREKISSNDLIIIAWGNGECFIALDRLENFNTPASRITNLQKVEDFKKMYERPDLVYYDELDIKDKARIDIMVDVSIKLTVNY